MARYTFKINEKIELESDMVDDFDYCESEYSVFDNKNGNSFNVDEDGTITQVLKGDGELIEDLDWGVEDYKVREYTI